MVFDGAMLARAEKTCPSGVTSGRRTKRGGQLEGEEEETKEKAYLSPPPYIPL